MSAADDKQLTLIALINAQKHLNEATAELLAGDHAYQIGAELTAAQVHMDAARKRLRGETTG